MELVPIVITVLEIVTGLAVVTLLISYILFRIRQKAQPTVVGRPHDMKPHFVDRGLKRLTQITREILPPVKKEAPRPLPVQKRRDEEKKFEVKKHTEKRPTERKTERRFEDTHKRVEVVNKPTVITPQQNRPPVKNNTKPKADLNTLGNDILDKYVDEDNPGMFTLKTNKKEEDKE